MSVLPFRILARAMGRIAVWALCVAVVVVAAPPAAASAASVAPVASAAPAASSPASSTAFAGVVFGRLPSGLGRRSDFRYRFAGVRFAAAVWEWGPNATGGYRESLDAVVMHGARLVGPRVLHDWYLHYQQRPARDCRYRRLRIHGHFGWTCRDQAFWLMRPGMAVSVQLDRRHWRHPAVVRLAEATHQRRGAGSGSG